MLKDLNTYWPSLASNNNNDFWNHEWKKHGTCVNFSEAKTNKKYTSIDDSIIYFEKSLEIYKKLDVENFLKQNSFFYTYNDLVKRFKFYFNTNNFDSVCYYDKYAQKQYILEIRFKLDKNWELSLNDTLKQTSNCYKSKPIYVFPERLIKKNTSAFTNYNHITSCLLIILSFLLF